jgi:uncharacterized protein DUF6847
MKVAEALAQVKDLKGKISDVQTRIQMNYRFKKVTDLQDVPSIADMLDEFEELNEALRRLKTRIAKTNVSSGLSARIHEMEMLRYWVKGLEVLENVKQEEIALERVDYEGPAQPFTTYATYNVADLTAQLEEARIRIRKLDMELQQLNWSTDLVEL